MAAEVEMCSGKNTHARGQDNFVSYLFPWFRLVENLMPEKRERNEKIVLWGLRSLKFVSVFSSSSSPNHNGIPKAAQNTIKYIKTRLARIASKCVVYFAFSTLSFLSRCIFFLHSAQRPTKEKRILPHSLSLATFHDFVSLNSTSS